jgi:hypothetical protein
MFHRVISEDNFMHSRPQFLNVDILNAYISHEYRKPYFNKEFSVPKRKKRSWKTLMQMETSRCWNRA